MMGWLGYSWRAEHINIFITSTEGPAVTSRSSNILITFRAFRSSFDPGNGFEAVLVALVGCLILVPLGLNWNDMTTAADTAAGRQVNGPASAERIYGTTCCWRG